MSSSSVRVQESEPCIGEQRIWGCRTLGRDWTLPQQRILVSKARRLAPEARVISILGGAREGKVIEDDLDLERQYSLVQSAAQFATMQTLSWDYFAAQAGNESRSFIHAFPGIVNTGLLSNSATGLLGVMVRILVAPLLSIVAQKPEDVGESMLFYGTAPQYAKGSWSLDSDGTSKVVSSLVQYRNQQWPRTIWEHNQRIFQRVTSR